MNGVFVCVDLEEAQWLVDHVNPRRVPVDIWRFASTGVRLLPSDHGFLYSPDAIGPSRIELIEAARLPPVPRLRGAFAGIRRLLRGARASTR
jgi:hypothetical protein